MFGVLKNQNSLNIIIYKFDMYDIISLSIEGSTDLSQYSISIRGAENWFKMQSGFSALHFKPILILSAGQNCRYQGKGRRRSEAT